MPKVLFALLLSLSGCSSLKTTPISDAANQTSGKNDPSTIDDAGAQTKKSETDGANGDSGSDIDSDAGSGSTAGDDNSSSADSEGDTNTDSTIDGSDDDSSDPPEIDECKRFHNAALPTDVNGDGFTSPIDLLTLINYLNANGQQTIPKNPTEGVPNSGSAAPDDILESPQFEGEPRKAYFDVNEDCVISDSDRALVEQALN